MASLCPVLAMILGISLPLVATGQESVDEKSTRGLSIVVGIECLRASQNPRSPS